MEANVQLKTHLSAVLDLAEGDIIRVDGPDGWSSVTGQVVVKTLAPKIDSAGELIDVTVTVKKLNRHQELPSPCSGGSYFSASKCTVTKKAGAVR
jgi:hypothetical protein